MFRFVPIHVTLYGMKDSLKGLFLLGNYKEVLSRSIERSDSSSKLLIDDYKWVIGALCFLGRKEEAEALFKELNPKSESDFIAACRFFLGVAFCRHGHYAKARRFFADNLRSHRKDSGDRGFFAWQGLAFYRYFRAEFKKSESAALKALTHATVTQFIYGRVLALDIIGHSLLQLGQHSMGLARLADAKRAAENLGNGGLVKSIEISSLIYVAQFGFAPRTIIKDLQNARRNIDPQNSYTQAALLLELANQFILRGKILNASNALNEASTLIYGSQHRRYGHLLALRFAEVAYRRGEFASALHTVQMQRSLLNDKYDRLNLLMALSLEIKLLIALGMDSQVAPLATVLAELTNKTAHSISRNILARHSNQETGSSGEDKIEMVISLLTQPGAVHGVLRSSYHGFVYEALKLRPGGSWIAAGPNEILILAKGEVSRFRGRVPDQLLRLISALAAGAKRKEELVQEIWGYTYHPLHHDPLLYQSIARLREALGGESRIIEVSEEGYRFRKEFRFIALKDPSSSNSFPAPLEPRNQSANDDLPKGLNERQIRILGMLKKKRFLSVRDCIKHFAVTDMTIKRDFSGLVKGGWVHRIGHARATCYTLQNNPDLMG